ncbi:hypothetical protein ETU08_04825 [Apibacter muscae]|uniref:hypothetical protein n=1 Tax=Apibacter muscae TaxID=2509004 RepID=UPI0011AD12BB|nr:hypothetical protein [Apibacter muscae]TWP30422.1 hypothetical protein ETU08_04825 [Apibacter muscae]
MKKDQTFYIPILCLIFLAGLIAMRYLPPINIMGYELKTIDMFSDVENEVPTVEENLPIVAIKPQNKIQCPEGQICIEDYSEDQNYFGNLFHHLQNISLEKDKVRIAFFGDSFIEGDILSGDFRNLLQDKFGGSGVGWVPIASEVAQFRQTIKENFKGFKNFDAVHNPKEKVPYPPFGICTIPLTGNEASFYGTNFSSRTEYIPGFRLFYQTPNTLKIKVETDKETQEVKAEAGTLMNIVEVNYHPAKNVNLSFSTSPNTYLYGVSFEGSSGVYVDNFSLRGNSGLSLLSSSDEMHKALNKIQDYKLVILQYGINAVNEKTKDLSWYTRMMNKVVAEVKEAYPQAAILLVGVGDRSRKINGQYKTMPTIKLMIDAQRSVAAENKIAFWNMYEAMGGENSMVNYVKSKPPKANLDYTHLNFLGGKEIGSSLYKSLLFEYERYKNN